MKRICMLLALVILWGSMTLISCTVDPEPNPPTDFEYEVSEAGDAIYLKKYVGTALDVVIPAEIDGLPVRSLKGISEERYGYTTIVVLKSQHRHL